jgi:Tol biopolymer transport system component
VRTGIDLQRLTVGARATRDAPRWSPDGSRIAVQILRGENYDIGVVRFSDRKWTEFASSSAYDGMYTWSPDSLHLAFISGRDGFDGLYTADADGQHPLRLTGTPSLNPAWAPRPFQTAAQDPLQARWHLLRRRSDEPGPARKLE